MTAPVPTAAVEASGFRPCGHSALGCSNGTRPCCRDCDHPTYWRALDAEIESRRRPVDTVDLPAPAETTEGAG